MSTKRTNAYLRVQLVLQNYYIAPVTSVSPQVLCYHLPIGSGLIIQQGVALKTLSKEKKPPFCFG
jgi:hypothetical protein